MPDFAALAKRTALALLLTGALCASWWFVGHGGAYTVAAVLFAVPLTGLTLFLLLRGEA